MWNIGKMEQQFLIPLCFSHFRVFHAHEAGIQALRLPRQQGRRLRGRVRRRVPQERLLQDLQLPVSKSRDLTRQGGDFMCEEPSLLPGEVELASQSPTWNRSTTRLILQL